MNLIELDRIENLQNQKQKKFPSELECLLDKLSLWKFKLCASLACVYV